MEPEPASPSDQAEGPEPAGRPAATRLRLLIAGAILLVMGLLPVWLYLWLISAKAPLGLDPLRIEGFSRLSPVRVQKRVKPSSVAELAASLKESQGPFSIVGAGYGTGGQTACAECMALDLSALDEVLEIDRRARTVRVQAGITWRELLRAIDRHGLAVKQMPAYANFSVGGSLSTDALGPYPRSGPIAQSVLELRIALASGEIVRASASERPELFHGVIGGLGALGVIVEATLRLEKNEPLERSITRLSLEAYSRHLKAQLLADPAVVIHRATLDLGAPAEVHAETWKRTRAAVTEPRRLAPAEPPRPVDQALRWLVSELPFGHVIQRRVVDRWAASRSVVALRNFEASRDLAELRRPDERGVMDVLEEHCVPYVRLASFARQLAAQVAESSERVASITLRYAASDSALLRRAPQESVCFTLHARVGTSVRAEREASARRRARVAATLAVHGVPSLAYGRDASREQLEQAYPGLSALRALKARLDPDARFHSDFWAAYAPHDSLLSEARRTFAEHASPRAEERAFLDLPHFLLRTTAEEVAAHLRDKPPSTFPFLESAAQLWVLERSVLARARDYYLDDSEAQAESLALTCALSLEYLGKGLYESTLGRVTEWFACDGSWAFCNSEDGYAAKLAQDYADSLKRGPWYEYPFDDKLVRIHDLDGSRSASKVRSLERKTLLLLEYGSKAAYAAAQKRSHERERDPSATSTPLWIERPSTIALPPGLTSQLHLGRQELVLAPRHAHFDEVLRSLFERGIKLRAVAGHDRVSACVSVPRGQSIESPLIEETLRWPVITNPSRERALLFLPVAALPEVMSTLARQGIELEHVLEY